MSDDPTPMTCDRLRELLVEHVDGLLGAAEAAGARAHLAGCPSCRLLQEEVRRNFAAMDAWEDVDLPGGAWERLEARLPAGPVARLSAAAPAPAAAAAAPPRAGARPAPPGPAGRAPAAPPAPRGGGPRRRGGGGGAGRAGAPPPPAGAPPPPPPPRPAPPPAAAPRRSWVRLAVPYVAGLATAAAAALVFLFPIGEAPPLERGPEPAAVPAPAPPAAPLVAERGSPASPSPALRPGENRLRFDDYDNGVIRTVAFPGGLDPSKVMLVDTPAVEVPGSGELVR